MAEEIVRAGRMPIPDWPGYFADVHGQIWSRKSGEWRRMKTFATTKGGYRHVELGRGSRTSAKQIEVHRLVCMAFRGRPPLGKNVARHLDGNPENNNPENLAWGTHADNSADMVRHGRSLTGSLNHNAKLTESDVLAIRSLRAAGATTVELSARYGITTTNVSFICSRRTWRHLNG